ncbi:hypothetical protein ACIGNX_19900 [Actinosynnema sp. NPDC053489]|uniref:hypothetical protein n=1 Tax=Actinosynnema sp. NPDC053489 TaxID=3363916 RepID=UPI0037CA4390
MFEEQRPASQKKPKKARKKVTSVVLLTAGGAVVATVIATLASVLTGDGSAPVARPEPLVEVGTTAGVPLTGVPGAGTATVVVTVSKPVTTQPGPSPGAKPADPAGPDQGSTAEPVSDQGSTTQSPSNPPSSYHPTPSPSSTSSSTTTTTTTPPPPPTEDGAP